MQRWGMLWGCLWGLTTVGPAAGSEFQSLATIREAIAAHLESIIRRDHRNFDVEVAFLDARLRLPRCSRPLTVVLLRQEVPIGAVSVGVECQGEHPWTIYARAHVRVFQEVVALNRPLVKGAVLDRDMLVLRQADIAALRQGYFSEAGQVLGKRLTRTLPKGSVLTPRLLTEANVVHKGDAVMIRALAGALEVRMGGHALTDGALGQRVRVRNDRSQRVVEGVVRGAGEVVVTF